MESAIGRIRDSVQIRKIVENWAEAIRDKDSKRLTADCAPDVLVFDLINPLEYVGSDALERRAHQWLSSFRGQIDYEAEQLSITIGEEVAFCHSLNRVKGTTRRGKIEMRWRSTTCFRKIAGMWMVTHQHNSVPFDLQTGKASLDLNNAAARRAS